MILSFVWLNVCMNINHHRQITMWAETGRWEETVNFLVPTKVEREPKSARLLSVFIHITACGNIPDPNVSPAGLPVLFSLQHEITCHKEAEKSQGGEKDKCRRGERGGLDVWVSGLMWQAARLASTSHRDVKCWGWLRFIASLVFFPWWKTQNKIGPLITS